MTDEFEIFSKVAEDMAAEYGDDEGIRMRKYTGRMMNTECVGLVVPHVSRAIEFAARVAIVTGDERPLMNACMDQLGKALIVFWPDFPWETEETESEEET